jgi:hypothetical protein
MGKPEREPGGLPALEPVLGYLNFSAGTADPQFLAHLNGLFEFAAIQGSSRPLWQAVHDLLARRLGELAESSPTFRDSAQAAAVLDLVFARALPAYRQFHRDLLFHQTDATLFRPFFIGRVCEAVLSQGGPWDEPERIVPAAIRQLNDFLGHRPVAALETQRLEPYAHEFVRPIPLYVRGAGISFGPEREVIAAALTLLETTDPNLLRRAYFDPALLDELAVDSRAYDFDHPANKRPNYHFGQWDPHHLDNQGRYRRFVVQQVTLDALMRRLTDASDLPAEELLLEAASVLAGTILMASGISGEGPATFDSTVTLSKLLPHIARYRDDFYSQLFQRISGEHAERLRVEAAEKRQPFGGARQHLNAQLARQRASQLEHVHLAQIFARMGHTAAAQREASIVPCASARILCQIDCLMATSHLACEAGQIDEAAGYLPQIVDLLKRGIECGAIVDPWNILGFDAHYSLFPSPENSVRDHRADDLVALIDRLWALYSQVWSGAAATDNAALSQRVSKQFHDAAQWWHKFAVHEVSSVEADDSLAVYRAAERVAQALNVWHRGGAAAGDVAFWQPHAEMFDSPKAYALVIEALLAHGDHVASMALLIHWLGQADHIGLQRADASWYDLTQRWLGELTVAPGDAAELGEDAATRWDQARKFLDYVESNAEAYWHIPRFALAAGKPADRQSAATAGPETDDEENDWSESAYEDVVFRDSTDDGVEGSIFETDTSSHDELLAESRRVAGRLAFLGGIARLWRLAAISPALHALARGEDASRHAARAIALRRWTEQAEANCRGMAELLVTVREFRIPEPGTDHDSNVEYDRRRMSKESLLERIVSTSVETADAARLLRAAATVLEEPPPAKPTKKRSRKKSEAAEPPAASVAAAGELAPDASAPYENRRIVALFAALLRQDTAAARAACTELLSTLVRQPLLYVPLAKGGDPQEIVAVRSRQHAIQDLLAWLPRIGLWVETCELLETARQMERDHPVGAGAVTEFDELFKIGYRAIVESLVASAERWPSAQEGEEDETQPEAIVSCLEKLTESLLTGWLAHSRTLRLSVLERVHDKVSWRKLVDFIERYGDELFSQRFLNLANIRGILHQGVARWISRIQEDPDAAGEELPEKLLSDIAAGESLDAMAEQLTLVLEAIVENYGEYRDYNSTTTQSDKGELLYMLLDFLRLRTRYDRVCWNLKPVVLAHEILVRRSQEQAARIWRKALTDRINDEANQYLAKLADLQKKYAMRMPTVADRLAERFIRPLAIDRIRALVAPAIEEAKQGGECTNFEILDHDTGFLTREPTGVGLDVPAWLVALEEEVEQALRPRHLRLDDDDLEGIVPQVFLSQTEARRQLNRWANRQD